MDDTWEVLLPKEIEEAGPAQISDVAAFTSISEIGDRPGDLEKKIGKFDAVILRLAELDAKVLRRADNLKVIAKHGTGLDNVDVSAATESNIVVCNNPGVNARAVAEFAITMMLALRSDIHRADAHLRDGVWNREPYLRHEVQKDVLGLFGCGNIGAEVAQLADGLGMRCLVYDPYKPKADLPNIVEKVEKAALFERSNVVSVHAPLTDETRHSIAANELELLSRDATVINTARGGIIDEDELVRSLKRDHIGGAALDAFEEEPVPADHPIFEYDNTIVTPHIGGGTVEARTKNAIEAAEKVRTVYEGSIPDTAVNGEQLQGNL